jgi:hypothetical protein
MSDEIVLSVNDDVTTYEPDFDVGMTIANGSATYWIVERRELLTPNEKGGQTRSVVDRTVEVPADVWRNAVKLLHVAEMRQMRAILKEALDGDVGGTFAADVRRIADRTIED